MKNLGTVLLETERLVLRRFKSEDIPKVYKNWSGNPSVTKYLAWNYHKNEEETKNLLEKYIKKYKRKSFYVWAVERKEDSEVIGTVDATVFLGVAEIGYCFGEKFWGNGYATEALKEMLDFLMNRVGCKKILATCAVLNLASANVLTKSGFKLKSNKETYTYSTKGIISCHEYELKC